MRIDRAIFKYIEHELYSYEDSKRELALTREEIIEGEEKPEVSVMGGSLGNKTQNKAIKLMTSNYILKAEKVIQAIEKSLKLLDDKHRALFELKYKRGLPWQETSIEMGISDRTYYRLRRELVTIVGQQMGLINIK